MRNWLLHIVFIGLLGSIVVACNNEGLIPEFGDEDRIHVTFTLSMSNPMTSRASESWGENTNGELGDYYDNQIDPNSLQVLICDMDGTPKVKVEHLLYYRTADKLNIYKFEGDFKVSPDDIGTDCKIMVFANCPEVEITTDLSGFLPYIYDKNKGIPMWGVKSVTLNLAPGSYNDLEKIDILRAMAKVQVKLAEQVNEYTLEGVNLINHNTDGYSLPISYTEIANTTSLDILQGFNPLESRASQSYVFSKKEDGSYIAYMPECDNTSKGVTPAKIKVTLNDKEYTIDFKDYNNGGNTSFNVIRNHYYSFVITGVGETNMNLQLKYRAMPWTDKTQVDIEFN